LVLFYLKKKEEITGKDTIFASFLAAIEIKSQARLMFSCLLALTSNWIKAILNSFYELTLL